MSKYRCTLDKPFVDTQVVTVEWDALPNENRHIPHRTQVWWRDGKARCCGCQGPLTGMSGSCEHARAVKRFMSKGAANGQ